MSIRLRYVSCPQKVLEPAIICISYVLYFYLESCQVWSSTCLRFHKKGDCSNPSNYCPIALISSYGKFLKFILNRKIFKHLSLHNLLSNVCHGLYQGCCTDHLLVSLTEFWSSFIRDFCETYVSLGVSKAFDRIWHKTLINLQTTL